MDKYEYTTKVEKIKKLVGHKDYVAAAKVADSIDWSRVKEVKLLTMVAEIYERTRRYEDAKEVLLCAYEVVPEGRRLRNLLYRLTELAIKAGSMEEAYDFFEEFREVAPSDAGQYILCYQMAAAQGEPLDKQIALLEAYKKKEFEEKWIFELARLYSKAGDAGACVKACDEILLWFGYGRYVEKAMELKQRYEELTPAQVEKLERGREQAEMEARENSPLQTVKPTKQAKTAKTARVAKEARAEQETAVTAERKRKVARLDATPRRETEKVVAATSFAEEKEWSEPRYAEPQPVVVKTEEPRVRQLEDLLAEAMLTSAQFDADGFAFDLPIPAMVKSVGEVELPVEEVAMLSEEALMPQLDLVCIREVVEETAKEAEVESSAQLEEVLQELGVSTEVEENSTLAAAVAEIVAEESIVAVEPELEKLAAEEVVEAKAPAVAEPEETKEEVALEEELAQLTALLQESIVEAQETAKAEPEENVMQEAKSEEAPVEMPPMADPEGAMLEMPSMQEEEEEEELPVFACVLMEANDLTKIVPRAVDVIKRTHARLETPSTQAAKISGAKLNKKGIKSSLERLNGRDLIVEGAGVLEKSVLGELVEVLRRPNVSGVVVLADEPDGLHKLIDLCPEIVDVTDYEEEVVEDVKPVAEQVDRVQKELDAKRKAEEELRLLMEERARVEAERKEIEAAAQKAAEAAAIEAAAIAEAEEAKRLAQEAEAMMQIEAAVEETVADHIPQEEEASDQALTADQFVKYVESYATKLECVLDSKARLAICEIAEQMKEDGEVLTREVARELTDDAIYLAEKPSLRGLFAKKYDKDGYLILKEQHFNE